MRKNKSTKIARSHSNAGDWLHPDEVVTYGRNASAFTSPISRIEWNDSSLLLDDVSIGSFTCNPDDHLLIAYSAIPNTSGWKLAHPDDDASDSAPQYSGNQLHLSAHSALLGSLTGNYLTEAVPATVQMGAEARAVIAYFDRENRLVRHCSSAQDVSSPYDGSVFGGITSGNDVDAGTDADLGSIAIELELKKMQEIGSVRIIRWTAGNAPAIGIIETCMEWMWYDRSQNNHFIWYPSLINYQN